MSLNNLSSSNSNEAFLDYGEFRSGVFIQTSNQILYFTNENGIKIGYQWKGLLPHTTSTNDPNTDGGISDTAWCSIVGIGFFENLENEGIDLNWQAHLPTVEVSYNLPHKSLKIWEEGKVSTNNDYWLYTDGTVWGGVGSLGTKPDEPFKQIVPQNNVIEWSSIATEGQNQFTVPYEFTNISIFINGVLQNSSTGGYVVNGSTVTLNGRLKSGDDIHVLISNVPIRDLNYVIPSDLNIYPTKIELSEVDGASSIGLQQGGVIQDAINYITPEMFGAKSDGVTNNDNAFSLINNYVASIGSATLLLSKGTYLLSQWDIPETLKVVGQGKGISILSCSNINSELDWFIRCCASTSKQWISELHSFSILGKGKAKYSLLLTSSFTTSAVSKGVFSSLDIKGGTISPLALDATQNSLFTDLNIVGTDSGGLGSMYGIALLNGAANNTIIAAEIAAGIVGIYLGKDSSLGGYNVSGLQQYPNGNIFLKSIIEKVTDANYTRTKAIHIVNGNKNKFDMIEMLVGSECAIHIESGNYNKFYDCTPGSNSQVTIPVVNNGGYGTLLSNCTSENINGLNGTYHVVTSNRVLLFNNRAGGLLKWRVQNTSGNTANNISHLDNMSYSSNLVNVPPTQLDTGLMSINSGSQLYVGTPNGIKQIPFYTQKNVSTSLMTYTAGSTYNTLSLTYQLTDGFSSEINIIIRGNTDRSHRAFIRLTTQFNTATVAWYNAQIISAAYNDSYLSNAVASVNSSGLLTVSVSTNTSINQGDYRLDERILINIA